MDNRTIVKFARSYVGMFRQLFMVPPAPASPMTALTAEMLLEMPPNERMCRYRACADFYNGNVLAIALLTGLPASPVHAVDSGADADVTEMAATYIHMYAICYNAYLILLQEPTVPCTNLP